MACNGTVHVSDFANSFASSDISQPYGCGCAQDNICGMEVDFAELAPDETHRHAMGVAIPVTQRIDVLAALGANHDDVLCGRGLMFLVHNQLRTFETQFFQL